ncbi:extracellular solute-binding protein [Paenibacillaceae bacterium]|nr:extracellular solute-binding protein [Paenibacillaceae bacterium]
MRCKHTRSGFGKISCAVLSMMLITALLAGCAQKTEQTPPATAVKQDGNENTENNMEPVTLSYYVALHPDAARSLKSMGETLLFQELEKRSNVRIDFRHPAVGGEAQQFNLMIASGNLPDLIEYNYTTYPGGPEKALADQVIIPLNDLIREHAPNLQRYLDRHPDILKQLTTDDGVIYAFPAIGAGQLNIVSAGLMLRKDWLDELNLDVPVTISDWTEVLQQFKTRKGAATPLSMVIGNFEREFFNGAYGIGTGFYQDEGTVKYGPLEPAYKDYLALLHQWYADGLLDPDFPTQDAKSLDTKIINGQTGAFVASIGSGMGKYLAAGREKEPAYDLVAAQFPVFAAGDQPFFMNRAYEYRGSGSAAITPGNKHPELSAQWLDYFYSDEGNMLKQFGVEGVTYSDDNGYPRYSDLIMNNPDKLSVGEALSKYLRVSQPSPGFVGDDRFTEQYYGFPQQTEAAKLYSTYEQNALKVQMPRVSVQDAAELSTIMAEVKTYVDEMFLKFVLGAEPISGFDKFAAQLKKMNIERAIQINQEALERYNAKS